MKQKDLFGKTSTQETSSERKLRQRREQRNVDGSYKQNPMLRLYGETPGKKCKTCEHLCYNSLAKKYYKCRLRRISSSPATDHRVNWPACGKYMPKIIKKLR